MMRSILAGAILIGCTLLCRAQYEGTAAAKALDHKGHDAEQNNMYAEALADFRQALALDSNYADAYTDEFDASVGVAIQARRPHANPNSALLAKAAQLEPDKATVAAQYSQTLKDNPAAYKAATLALLEKFPADPEAAGALYYYAAAQKTEADEVEWLERLQRQFPPDKYLWGEMGEVELFRIEDHTDPAKARRLADDMARLKPQGDDWAEYTGYADAMATAEEALKSVKAPYYGLSAR
jgi:hypothetical protein